MNKMPSELLDIAETIERDKGLWQKVAGLNLAKFEIRFCCNSGALRRARVLQRGSAAVRPAGVSVTERMPNELIEILSRCREEGELKERVEAFSEGKIDIVFLCGGGALRDVLIQEIS